MGSIGWLWLNCVMFYSLSINVYGETGAGAGRDKAEDNRCIECHGADGNGQALGAGSLGKFPKLAGQYQAYLIKQLQDFRSEKRKHDLMSLMAKALDEEDIIPLAEYFSRQPKMQGVGVGNSNPLGKSLFTLGDAKRNIIPCGSCHGVNGKGIDGLKPQAPVIGGQEVAYLIKQLEDWRSGERHNGEGAVMNGVAKLLTDAEIQAVADYLAGL